jgi:hypothetical protein
MKYLYIYILICFFNISYSQSYEYIKKLDTIYIPFKKSTFNIFIDYPEEENGFKNRRYILNYKMENVNTISFELDRKKLEENKKVKKSFFKKNKEKIIEIELLKNYDYQDIACVLFNRLKIIYIIDFSEKKVMLYRVMSMNYCYIGE